MYLGQKSGEVFLCGGRRLGAASATGEEVGAAIVKAAPAAGPFAPIVAAVGSVAEAIFRRTECLVLTVGPGSLQDSPVGSTRAIRPFLFATSFSEASLHALPYAISAANHFGTQLVLLHVVAVVPMPEGVTRPSADDVMQAREKTHTARIRQLTEWTLQTPKLAIEPEFLVEFGLPSEKILQAANDLKADAIVLGLHRSTHIGTAAHMPWATAYEVVCGAGCSVLTVRN